MDSKLFAGTLELLILDVVSDGPNYGYQIAHAVLSRSSGAFELKEGSLYPALHRLERQELLSSSWSQSEDGRRRKYYKLTAKGRRALKKKREEWARFSNSVEAVLGASVELA